MNCKVGNITEERACVLNETSCTVILVTILYVENIIQQVDNDDEIIYVSIYDHTSIKIPQRNIFMNLSVARFHLKTKTQSVSEIF
jgi:hypothetical protein